MKNKEEIIYWMVNLKDDNKLVFTSKEDLDLSNKNKVFKFMECSKIPFQRSEKGKEFLINNKKSGWSK